MDEPTPTDTDWAQSGSDSTLTGRLETWLSATGQGLPLAEVSRIVSDIAAELDALHGRGRTHGDVRAARIAASARRPARLLGPEWRTMAGGTVEGDVAGLAAAASFALYGVEPNRSRPASPPGDAASETSAPPGARPETEPARPLDSVSTVLAKGMAPLGDERYASAGEFAAALREVVLRQEANVAMLAQPGRPRSRFLLPVSVLTACALLALGVWMFRERRGSPLPSQAPSQVASTPAAPSPSRSLVASSPAPEESLAPSPRRGESGPDFAPANPPRSLRGAERVPPPQRPMAPGRPPSQPSTMSPSLRPPTFLPPRILTAPITPRAAAAPKRRAATSRPRTKPSTGMCYLRVYARQFVSMQDVVEHRVSFVRPRRVLVDGNPSRSLAAGHWTALPPGAHKLAFYPVLGVPFDPNTKFWVRVGPRRRSFQIPLPRHPGGIPGYRPKKSDGPKRHPMSSVLPGVPAIS